MEALHGNWTRGYFTKYTRNLSDENEKIQY